MRNLNKAAAQEEPQKEREEMVSEEIKNAIKREKEALVRVRNKFFPALMFLVSEKVDEGKGGWDDESMENREYLIDELVVHAKEVSIRYETGDLSDRDLLDVAAFAMFLWSHGKRDK